ncbi:MAG: hypothetical protein HKN12_04315 [Gemmatimonadetes bacterium]|nr:hypothetical protein [Gemmatimonadota bacterium]
MGTRQVSVELHARAMDLAGSRHAEVRIPDGATSAELKASLGEAYPGLREMLGVSVIATDEEYLAEGAGLGPGDRFHLIPPVSGG